MRRNCANKVPVMKISDEYIEIFLSQATEVGNILFWRYFCGSAKFEILGKRNYFFEELQLPVREKTIFLFIAVAFSRKISSIFKILYREIFRKKVGIILIDCMLPEKRDTINAATAG